MRVFRGLKRSWKRRIDIQFFLQKSLKRLGMLLLMVALNMLTCAMTGKSTVLTNVFHVITSCHCCGPLAVPDWNFILNLPRWVQGVVCHWFVILKICSTFFPQISRLHFLFWPYVRLQGEHCCVSSLCSHQDTFHHSYRYSLFPWYKACIIHCFWAVLFLIWVFWGNTSCLLVCFLIWYFLWTVEQVLVW